MRTESIREGKAKQASCLLLPNAASRELARHLLHGESDSEVSRWGPSEPERGVWGERRRAEWLPALFAVLPALSEIMRRERCIARACC